MKALAAWLADADGYYADAHQVLPSNGWDIVMDAARAATVYE
jgi:hypothetical protein